MTAPIDKAADAIRRVRAGLPQHVMDDWDELSPSDQEAAREKGRAALASIDTDELAQALAPWLGTGQSANNAAEAVKAHLLKEDS